ncbi:PreATP-grasp domain-containing protein, partial [Meredithblackwellia eburnea MCA 4105]
TKLLIANRGEIALRIIRTCRKLGILTVAVYSSVDAHAQHVLAADESYLLGPPTASESYLNIDKVIDVARRCGAQAIHPGYGFLSENTEFERRCRESGIKFVGPGERAIRSMGSKSLVST